MTAMVRRVLGGVALVALAGALAACGVRSTVDPVAAAATRTQNAGGVEMKLTSSFGTPGHMITITGRGSFDDGQGEMEIDLSKLAPQAGGFGGGLGTVKTIYLQENGDPVIYLDFPLLSGMIGGKTWIRLDLEQAGKSLGVDVDKLMQGSAQNPADLLALLKADGTFTEVGQESVGGVSTAHYHGTIDLQKVIKDGGLSDEVATRLSEIGAPSDVPYDVWVDDRGLVRQIKQHYEQTLGGITTSYDTTVALGDYGKDVSVSAPPSDQVFDATDLASKATSSFGSTG
jgi:hypothetical protein